MKPLIVPSPILLLFALAACREDAARMLAPRFALCGGPRCGSDQGQLLVDTTIGPLAVGGTSQQILAQVVTPDSTGQVVQLNLPVGCDNTALRIEIHDVDPSGAPATPPAAASFTRLIPAAAVAGSPAWRALNLGRGFPVVAGTAFAFELSVVDTTRSCGVLQGPVGDPYPFGDGWFIALPNPPNVWEPLSLGTGRNDLPFETFVRLR